VVDVHGEVCNAATGEGRLASCLLEYCRRRMAGRGCTIGCSGYYVVVVGDGGGGGGDGGGIDVGITSAGVRDT
jgi:hypothetical protein